MKKNNKKNISLKIPSRYIKIFVWEMAWKCLDSLLVIGNYISHLTQVELEKKSA